MRGGTKVLGFFLAACRFFKVDVLAFLFVFWGSSGVSDFRYSSTFLRFFILDWLLDSCGSSAFSSRSLARRLLRRIGSGDSGSESSIGSGRTDGLKLRSGDKSGVCCVSPNFTGNPGTSR